MLWGVWNQALVKSRLFGAHWATLRSMYQVVPVSATWPLTSSVPTFLLLGRCWGLLRSISAWHIRDAMLMPLGLEE